MICMISYWSAQCQCLDWISSTGPSSHSSFIMDIVATLYCISQSVTRNVLWCLSALAFGSTCSQILVFCWLRVMVVLSMSMSHLRKVIYWKAPQNQALACYCSERRRTPLGISFRYSPGRVVLGMVGRVSAALPIHPDEFPMYAAHSNRLTQLVESMHRVNFQDVWWCQFPFWRCSLYLPGSYLTWMSFYETA